MRSRWLVVLSSLLAALPALPCDVILWTDPADAIGSRGLDVWEAPAGGLWWINVFGSNTDDVVLERVSDGTELALSDAEVVHRGPRMLGLRVPSAALPGDEYHFAVSSMRVASLTVTDGEPAPTTADPLQLDSVSVRSLTEVVVNGCTLGFAPREEHSVSVLHIVPLLPVGRSADELLIDLWVLPVGAERPADDEDRALDAYPAQGTGGDQETVQVRVGRDGEHDVHVRLIDPFSGARSEVSVVTLLNDDDREAGLDLLGGWHWGCAQTAPSDASLLALLLFGLFLRRRPSWRLPPSR